MGSRLQKMSGVFMISFFSMPVDMSSLSTITPVSYQRKRICWETLSRCNKSEMVAENWKLRSSWWGCYHKLIKTCWKRCSNYMYWNKCDYSESMKLLKKWQQVLERRHSARDLTCPGQRPGEFSRFQFGNFSLGAWVGEL